MSLRGQALLEFDLPAAPQRIDELAACAPGADACRVHAPAGRFLLLCSEGALAMAFEATLFDLLAESRYPAPRPRRARGGSLIAKLPRSEGAAAAAACYAWPPGEELAPAAATAPQLLEVGRLLARLHQLAEVHPASVPDPFDGEALLAGLSQGPDRDALVATLEAGLPALPLGAVHGGLRPTRALFVGDRCSSVLPSGLACSAALVLDVAEAALGWILGAARPAAALRALLSGYQSLRRLAPEESDALWPALRFAAAREGARRVAMRQPGPLSALKAVEAVGESDVRSAAGG
jgi:Ser/Thr protein kinase RdoA (MazF antagonist)